MPKTYAKSTTSDMMPEHFYKQKKSAAWYVRLVPSEALRTQFGVKEFRKSTGFSDLGKAKAVGKTLIADKLREWDSLLRSAETHKPNATPSILSDSLIETVCSARLYSWLRSDEEERLDGVDDATLLEIEEFSLLSDTAMRAILSQGKASARWTETTDLVLDWCATMGFEVSLEDPSAPKLIREFAKVERKAQQFILRRNDGEDIKTPPLPRGPQPKLSDITEMYLTHKAQKTGKSHSSTSVNAWLLFIQFAGDIPFQAVTTPLIKNFFKDRLHSANKPWSEKRVATFGKRTLSEVFALALGEGLFHGLNPVDQLTLLPTLPKAEEASRSNPRYPYSTSQLNHIFLSEWFNPRNTYDFRGKMRTDLGARYWVPIFGTLYGTRVREPLQLLCSDITQEAGINVIRLQVLIDEKSQESAEISSDDRLKEIVGARSLKNISSERVLPLHPKMLELGFLEFVENRRRLGGADALLFPSSEPMPGGENYKLGRAYEQSFLRYVRDKLGFGNGYGNHSYRHQFEDRLRNCQATKGLWPAGLSQQLAGRKRTRDLDRDFVVKEGSEALYGNGYSISALEPFYQRIDFSDVNFPSPYLTWLQGCCHV